MVCVSRSSDALSLETNLALLRRGRVRQINQRHESFLSCSALIDDDLIFSGWMAVKSASI